MPSRRDIFRIPIALPFMAQAQQPQKTRPFRVDIPQATIKRILTRVREARLPDRIDAPDWSYGVNWEYMRALAEYWSTKFDWRKAEANLNRYPQFLARVEDYDIHFYHVRGRNPDPMPLILTHGWPGSVFEFLEGIGPLSANFDVVVPSLPGFGFSSKPKGKPVGPVTTARLWHRLMTEVLGYRKFGAQGGDWGMRVTMELAGQFPDSLIGIHLNAAAAGPPIPDAEQTPEEREWVRAVLPARAVELDYFNEQQHKPQTVAFALYDNPIGAAAWIAEKMKGWSDAGFTEDQVLTNVMIYLVTDTMGTGVWFYRGAGDERSQLRGKLMTPTGFAAFPKEMPYLAPPRSVLERGFNLVHYTKMAHGGHFACLEQPELLAADVREFFGKLRG
jgi:pimeloyl-ACP methyl ester carboxylesterase